ncbi:MAG TPA: methyltransferase domain-containing protein [Terriglobia bacterium]|nr:methyltransferase domain-containing protein [Terriglobia bacterium]
MGELSNAVQQHYSRPILPFILEQLRLKGIAESQVRPEDLYPYDQSHAGGIAATRMLAELAGIGADALVIDIGCGFGSAARLLHEERRCRVVGVDLTPSRIETAVQLTRLVRLQSGVSFTVGSALSVPIASGSADAVWTQHVTMNVPDHAALIGECVRLLKPTGRLASHEWLRLTPGPLPYPVPWAPTPSLNHAIEAERFLALLREYGFKPSTQEVTEAMCAALESDALRFEQLHQPAERIAALRNLVRAARDGLLGCFFIVAGRGKPES